MKLFGWLRKKTPLFDDEESRLIVKAIRHAEQQTSGEVRVFVESHCSWVDALDRAAELFSVLKMDKTEQRNAVLVYLAIKDRQFALFGDEGIHRKVGDAYWNNLAAELTTTIKQDSTAKGVANCVIRIGEALHTHFPYDKGTDKNELPDEIVFGR